MDHPDLNLLIALDVLLAEETVAGADRSCRRLMWHPRMDADPGHRWLRGCVREVCGGEQTAA